ncbi:hypothetical protein RhiirB3_383297 [Rhizophagus irregularis]|nr:hypothetical protein RhiirB3_383297 [Rhizophagus irregularis]
MKSDRISFTNTNKPLQQILLLLTGQDLFSIVTKILDKYLTEPINNTIKTEISQYLFVTANMIELNNEELNCEQENPHKLSDGFIEDQFDAHFITLQAMIEEIGQEEVLEIWKVVDIRSERKNHVHFVIIVNAISYLCSCLKSISKGIIYCHYFRVMMNFKIAAFHISMIPQRWYKNLYQDETNLQEKVIFNNKKDIYDDETMNNNTLPVRKPVTIPITVPVLKKAVHKRNLYGRVWGLARTVTLLAVEQEDDEITLILLDYIRRKSNRNMPERLPIIINERSTIDEVSDNPQEIQRNYNDTNSRIENRSQIEEDETEKDREIIDTNLQNMKI